MSIFNLKSKLGLVIRDMFYFLVRRRSFKELSFGPRRSVFTILENLHSDPFSNIAFVLDMFYFLVRRRSFVELSFGPRRLFY
jgi:hypothetical protein